MAPSRGRSEQRQQFLTDILTTAIENYGYGWFEVDEYKPDGSVPLGEAYATIRESEEPAAKFVRVDLDVIAKGLGVIRRAEMREIEEPIDGVVKVLHNARTGERLYLNARLRQEIMLADRTNGDEGDIDVISALAILECALFGKVVYA